MLICFLAERNIEGKSVPEVAAVKISSLDIISVDFCKNRDFIKWGLRSLKKLFAVDIEPKTPSEFCFQEKIC